MNTTMTVTLKFARNLRAGDRLLNDGRVRQVNDAGNGNVEVVQFSTRRNRIVKTVFAGDEPIQVV